jgi:hypothetical protein
MTLRYAVLHHTGVPAPHFDLMFESAPGSALATWRSPAWPITVPTRVDRLPDHRPTYLTFEGPVSNNRGQVRRVAFGTVHPDPWTNDLIRLRLQPTQLPPAAAPADSSAGNPIDLTLARQPDGTWLATVGQTR